MLMAGNIKEIWLLNIFLLLYNLVKLQIFVIKIFLLETLAISTMDGWDSTTTATAVTVLFHLTLTP